MKITDTQILSAKLKGNLPPKSHENFGIKLQLPPSERDNRTFVTGANCLPESDTVRCSNNSRYFNITDVKL